MSSRREVPITQEGILQEIRSKKPDQGMVVVLYAALIMHRVKVNWPVIYYAIIVTWSREVLVEIRNKAWAIVQAQRSGVGVES